MHLSVRTTCKNHLNVPSMVVILCIIRITSKGNQPFDSYFARVKLTHSGTTQHADLRLGLFFANEKEGAADYVKPRGGGGGFD